MSVSDSPRAEKPSFAVRTEAIQRLCHLTPWMSRRVPPRPRWLRPAIHARARLVGQVLSGEARSSRAAADADRDVPRLLTERELQYGRRMLQHLGDLKNFNLRSIRRGNSRHAPSGAIRSGCQQGRTQRAALPPAW